MKCCVLAVIMVIAAISAACGDDGDVTSTARPTTPTPSPTAIPSPSPTPEVIDGIPIVPMKLAGEAEFPDDVALIIETGCWQCDGPTTSLERVYRNSAGEFSRHTLLAVEELGVGPRQVQSNGSVREEQPYFTGYVLSPDASQAVVGVCTAGNCVEVGGAPSPDAQTTLFRSLDGGETWERWGALDGGTSPVAIRGDGVLLARFSAERPERTYELFPGRKPVEPPESDVGWPMILPDGELLWPTDDGRILNSDGSTFLDVGTDTALVYQFNTLVSDPAGDELLFMVVERSLTDPVVERNFLFTADREGRVMRAFSVEFLPWLGAWLGPGLFLGNMDIPADQAIAAGLPALTGPMPMLLDLEAGVAHPIIEPFSDPDFPQGRNFLKHVQRGPFARVVGTGSCLNVRVEPRADAEVLHCAADGVLLREIGESGRWVHVLTTNGIEGWASMDYLER